jgi:large subunit ribosomal protein L18
MIKKVSRNEMRTERHKRIRKTLSGTAEKPRLNVFKSNANINAQIIDDVKGVTLVSASTLEKELKIKNGGNVEAAKLVGKSIAEKAKKAKIKTVVFDRSGYLYHGRVEALADAARENGLEF